MDSENLNLTRRKFIIVGSTAVIAFPLLPDLTGITTKANATEQKSDILRRKIMRRNRTIKSYTMSLESNPEVIFPLLCPVREYEWIQPWQCEMIYTNSGIVELDCVFKTNFQEDGPEDTWVVSYYEPPRHIEFVRVNSIRSIRYSIELTQQENKTTQALWKQIITGLNTEGDNFVASYKDEAYHEEMRTLEKMINHFIKTKEMLKITA